MKHFTSNYSKQYIKQILSFVSIITTHKSCSIIIIIIKIIMIIRHNDYWLSKNIQKHKELLQSACVQLDSQTRTDTQMFIYTQSLCTQTFTRTDTHMHIYTQSLCTQTFTHTDTKTSIFQGVTGGQYELNNWWILVSSILQWSVVL